jgi:hypothetical protein
MQPVGAAGLAGGGASAGRSSLRRSFSSNPRALLRRSLSSRYAALGRIEVQHHVDPSARRRVQSLPVQSAITPQDIWDAILEVFPASTAVAQALFTCHPPWSHAEGSAAPQEPELGLQLMHSGLRPQLLAAAGSGWGESSKVRRARYNAVVRLWDIRSLLADRVLGHKSYDRATIGYVATCRPRHAATKARGLPAEPAATGLNLRDHRVRHLDRGGGRGCNAGAGGDRWQCGGENARKAREYGLGYGLNAA